MLSYCVTGPSLKCPSRLMRGMMQCQPSQKSGKLQQWCLLHWDRWLVGERPRAWAGSCRASIKAANSWEIRLQVDEGYFFWRSGWREFVSKNCALHESCQSAHLPKKMKLTPKTKTLTEVVHCPRSPHPARIHSFREQVSTNMSI